jgi:site-specific DNA-methyltransferase (adenine-specific)
VELAYRLVRMFSFWGDTVLDPFVGTGSTMIAALRAERNSIGNEISPLYLRMARKRLQDEVAQGSLLSGEARLEFGSNSAESL